MAEILVKNVDRPTSNTIPSKIRIEQIKRGSVITVQEDGHEWSFRERDINGFKIIKLIDEPVAAFKYLLDDDVQVDRNGKPVLDDDGDEIIFRRKRHLIDLDDVPVFVRGDQTITLSKEMMKVTDKRVPPR